MKIYLAVNVFDPNDNWWDAHEMLGAYLSVDDALAAFKAEFPDETLELDSDDMAVVSQDENEPWRWVIAVELHGADVALKYGASEVAESLSWLQRYGNPAEAFERWRYSTGGNATA